MRRFFVEGSFAAGERVALTGADAYKLAVVLRAVAGDEVEVLDGGSRRFAGTVREVTRERVWVELGAELAGGPEPVLAVTLAQGMPKGQKMDFVIEKAVELGVTRIVPLATERTIAKAEGTAKLERWRRLAKSAAAQSGRTRVPAVAAPLALDQALALGEEHDAILMPWELAEPRPLAQRLAEIGPARRVLALIGPEGGFSQREAAQAQAAGAHLISLGPRILRTETAGLVLMAALLALRGEL